MAGRHRFSDLIEQLSAERRERVDRMADELGEEIDPEQLSEAASAKETRKGVSEKRGPSHLQRKGVRVIY